MPSSRADRQHRPRTILPPGRAKRTFRTKSRTCTAGHRSSIARGTHTTLGISALPATVSVEAFHRCRNAIIPWCPSLARAYVDIEGFEPTHVTKKLTCRHAHEQYSGTNRWTCKRSCPAIPHSVRRNQVLAEAPLGLCATGFKATAAGRPYQT